jgi:Flp pilus assembly protein protease CpaA
MNNWFALVSVLEICLLLYVAMTDIAARLIPNEVCSALAVLGIACMFSTKPSLKLVVQSLAVAGGFFLLLLVLHSRRWVGGGDVKLLVALAIGLPFTGLMQLLTRIALVSLVLALVHLLMRRLPYPKLSPVGSSFLRRAYAVERWRNLRHAPLPYGVAIAFGGIWTLLNHGV